MSQSAPPVMPNADGTSSGHAGQPTAARSRSRTVVARVVGIDELGVGLALVAMLVVIGAFHPDFLGRPSLENIGQQASFYGIMALGMVFLLAMREIDISVGAVYGVCIIESAVLMEHGLNPWIAAVVGVLIGVLLGGVNGVLTNLLGIPTIIVTLGTLSMYRGLTLILSDGRSVSDLPRDHPFFTTLGENVLGVPASIVAFAVLTVALAVLFRMTRFGFVVRAIGANPEAARLSGISIGRVRLLALMLQGGLCGVAGMLTLAYFASADSSLGVGYELLVIAAAIIGGTGLAGGSGTVVGAMLGSLVIAVISSGLVQFGVAANWTSFVTGVVIIAAVALDALVRRRKAARV